MVALITWDFFRAWYGTDAIKATSSLQAQFDMVNPLVGRMVQDYLGRYVFQAERTETFDVKDRQQAYFLRGMPLVSVTSVHIDAAGQFDGDEYEVSSTEYAVDLNTARLRILAPIYDSQSGLRVVYTGGMAADQAALLTPTHEFHGVAVAAAMQIKHLIERRDTLGTSSTSQGRGSRTYQSQDLLPLVRAALDPMRVWRAG